VRQARQVLPPLRSGWQLTHRAQRPVVLTDRPRARQFLMPLAAEPNFPALWASALAALAECTKPRSEELAEAVPEALKNMLLVMAAQGVLTPAWTVRPRPQGAADEMSRRAWSCLPDSRPSRRGLIVVYAAAARDAASALQSDAGSLRPVSLARARPCLICDLSCGLCPSFTHFFRQQGLNGSTTE